MRWVQLLFGIVLAVVIFLSADKATFLGGGALTAAGQWLQERSERFEGKTPNQILQMLERSNSLSSSLRRYVPGETRKPEVLVVMCMDPRLKESFIFGDTRQHFDVLRVPGSALSEEIMESIELSVSEHGIKVIIITTHTECAMEKVAHSDEARHYPKLSLEVLHREKLLQKLRSRSVISNAIAEGKLLIEARTIDTKTGLLLPR